MWSGERKKLSCHLCPNCIRPMTMWRTWMKGILYAFGHTLSWGNLVVVHFCVCSIAWLFIHPSIHTYIQTFIQCVLRIYMSQSILGPRNSRVTGHNHRLNTRVGSNMKDVIIPQELVVSHLCLMGLCPFYSGLLSSLAPSSYVSIYTS